MLWSEGSRIVLQATVRTRAPALSETGSHLTIERINDRGETDLTQNKRISRAAVLRADCLACLLVYCSSPPQKYEIVEGST